MLPIAIRRVLAVLAGVLICLIALAPYLDLKVLSRPFVAMWTGGLLLLNGADKIFPPEEGRNLNTSGRDLFLSLSSVGLSVATALSLVFCFWNRPVRRKAVTLSYLFFLIVLVSMSTANFAFGDALLSMKAQVLIDLALVIVASISMAGLLRLRPTTAPGIVIRAVIVFLLFLQGIALPGIYALFWFLNWQNALSVTQTRNFNPAWLSAIAGVASAAIASLNYRNTKKEAGSNEPGPRTILH